MDEIIEGLKSLEIEGIDNGDGTITWRTVPDPHTRAEHREFGKVLFGGFEEIKPPPLIFKPSRCLMRPKDRPND